MGLFRNRGSRYSARQIDEPSSQSADDVPGRLLQIVPYTENEALLAMSRVLRSIHDVRMEGLLRRRNVSEHHSFELWFSEGKLQFFMHAADAAAAETLTSRVESSYPEADVFPVTGVGFPSIQTGDYVAGAAIQLDKHHYYPVRQFRLGEGFDRDPYAEITSEMLTTTDSHVVVQVVFRPEPTDWTDGGGLLRSGSSVDDVADALKNGQVTGWRDPHIREPSQKDKQAAKIIEQQRGKPAYNVTLRVVAMSPDEGEATARCKGVAEMFERHYNATTEQGFDASPVPAAQVDELLRDCRRRTWDDRSVILTIDELVGIAHLPREEEVTTPNITWKTAKSGTHMTPESATR